MGERSEYAPGTFCWVELTTPEKEAAKDFYAGLFGWEMDDLPVGEGMTYTMASLGGKVVAALAGQPAQQRDAGVPPMWNSYISVASADQTAARAAELGAEVHAGPFDVMEAGRMAVIQDPQGAFFELWQPNQTIGAALVNAPGAHVWNELSTPDQDASAAFYSALFGWRTQEFPGMAERYLTIMNADRSNGGILHGLMPPQAPPQWIVYFGVDDLDEALARIGSLGGRVLRDPVQIPVARLGFAMDPQGAMFALFDGDLDP